MRGQGGRLGCLEDETVFETLRKPSDRPEVPVSQVRFDRVLGVPGGFEKIRAVSARSPVDLAALVVLEGEPG